MNSKASKPASLEDISAALAALEAGSQVNPLAMPEDSALRPLVARVNALAHSLQTKRKKENERARIVRKLFDKVSSLVGYWDTQKLNVECNEAFAKFFGQTVEEIQGKSMKEVLGEKLYEKNAAAILATLGGQSQQFERSLASPKGDGEKHVSVQYIPDFVNGSVVGFFSVATDITEIVAREAKFRILIESLGEGYVLQTETGTILQSNPAARRLLGVTEGPLNGRSSQEPWGAIREDGSLVDVNDYPPMQALRSGKPVVGTVYGLPLQDGSYRWLKINSTPYDMNTYAVGRAQPGCQRLISTFSDITEQVRARQDADRLFQLAPDSIAFIGANGLFKRVNPAIIATLGYTEDEFQAKAFLSLVHSADLNRTSNEIARCATESKSVSFENRVLTKSGDYLLFSWVAQKDSQTGLLYLVGRDVTAQRQSEEENRFIFDEMQIGVWKYNPVSQSLHWNKTLYKVFDVREEDFTGHYNAWESTLSPEAKAQAVEDLRKAISGEKELDTTFEIDTKTKGRRHIGAKGRVIRDSAGEALMVYGINFDRTEEVESYQEKARLSASLEKALADAQTSEKTFRTLFEMVPVGIIQLRTDGSFLLANPAFEQMVGFKESKLLKRSVPDLMLASEIEAANVSLYAETKRQVTSGFDTLTFKSIRGLIEERQWTFCRSNQTEVQATFSLTPLREASGQIYGFLGIAKDLTEELKAKSEVEVERMKSLNNAKLASLGEMAGGVAHEINNPLSIITLSGEQLSEILHENPINQAQAIAMTNSITKTAERIAKIVQGLRTFSREGGSDPFQLITASELVNDTVSFCFERFRHNGTELRVEAFDPGIQFEGRATQISQVILNLLNNASDAVMGKKDRWVAVGAKVAGDWVELRITDSGQGIPSELRDKIFQPFFTTKEIGKGTGMGLSISLGIVKAHKGEIIVDASNPHTCFLIRLPLRQK